MEDPMRVGSYALVPLREITIRASRSSGPGGQHANSADSRIEAVFDVAASAALSDEQKALIISRTFGSSGWNDPAVVSMRMSERTSSGCSSTVPRTMRPPIE